MVALAFACMACATATAQADSSYLHDLPGCMYTELSGQKAPKAAKSAVKPLHTNAFIGTWTLRDRYGRRIHYWGDEHRMIFREMRDSVTVDRITVVDLQANVKLKMGGDNKITSVTIDDLYLPQAGYFRELFNDTVINTGRKETVMGKSCEVLLGANSNTDTTNYYRTTAHPKLFADLKVWAVWLCREGNLEYLSAFSDKNAGSSLRVTWKKQGYSTPPGDWSFEQITPGKQPMPVLKWRPNVITEERFLYTNNWRLGRLPQWMRERINRLAPFEPQVALTPPIVDRGFADNRFVGTFNAQTMTRYIDEHKDTTERFANYSYWADERRAVITTDAPHEKGIAIYMVDLDHDVAVAAYNEGHGYVIPKLYIGTLAEVGVAEVMGGIDLSLVAKEMYQDIAGQRCQLYMPTDHYTTIWLSTLEVPNPVLDMARWMEPRYIQARHDRHFRDIFTFGLKDRPMPFRVHGTYLTSFEPGKVPPPAMDLSNYRVYDERIEAPKREREREQEAREPVIRAYSIEDADNVAVPDEMPIDIKIDVPGGSEPPVDPPPLPIVPR